MRENKLNISYRAWATLIGACAMNLTMGVNYSWSLVKQALVTDWHWTNVEASSPYALYGVVYSITMIFAGRAQDKIGPRTIANIGTVVLGAGFIACSYAGSSSWLTFSYGFLVSLGYAICYATTLPSCIKWFPPEKRGVITGLVSGSLAMAAVCMAPIIKWMLVNFGINKTFLVLGLGVITVLGVSAQQLRVPPKEYRLQTSDIHSTVHAQTYSQATEIDWQEMLKTASFYRLWIMYFIATASGLMIIGHMDSIANIQAGWKSGFVLVSLVALFNAIGRFFGGFFLDRFGYRLALKVVLIVQAINLLAFFYYRNSMMLIVGAVITGACYGACFSIFALLSSTYYGTKNFGVNYGLLLTAWGFAGVIGPLLAAWVVDATGVYLYSYLIFAAACLISAAFSTQSCPQH